MMYKLDVRDSLFPLIPLQPPLHNVSKYIQERYNAHDNYFL